MIVGNFSQFLLIILIIIIIIACVALWERFICDYCLYVIWQWIN